MDAIHLPHSANAVPIAGSRAASDLDAVQSAAAKLRGPNPRRTSRDALAEGSAMTRMLTVLIPCKNESEQLAGCIRSAQELADEVLVADSGSTDGSIEIAQALGCRVIEREYPHVWRLSELGDPAGDASLGAGAR